MRASGVALHWRILIALVLGIGVGVAFNQWWTPAVWQGLGVGDGAAFLARKATDANAGASTAAYRVRFVYEGVDFVGDLFVRLLRMIAVPIVLCSLAAGVASLGDLRRLGWIGGRTLVLFLVTTVTAIVIGLALALAVAPGTAVSEATRVQLLAGAAPGAAVPSLPQGVWAYLLGLVPQNPLEALGRGDMLQVVVISALLGVALTLLPQERAEPVLRVLQALADAIAEFIHLLMRMAPYAVFALTAPIVAAVGTNLLGGLLLYALVVVAGLGIMLFGVYPALVYVLTLRAGGGPVTPRRFFAAMAPAQLLAFSSSSSNATLAVNMDCCINRLGVSKEVTSFVLPLGATVNMDGTALYVSVVAVFLAQLYGIPLTFFDLFTIVGTASLVAVGSAGVPGGSLVLIVVVLQAIRVPPDGVAIILTVDRILDMCRTVVNVSGDAAVAAVVAGAEGELSRPAAEGAGGVAPPPAAKGG